MSGLKLRFPRTAGSARPGRDTIERDKIRHHRPSRIPFEEPESEDDRHPVRTIRQPRDPVQLDEAVWTDDGRSSWEGDDPSWEADNEDEWLLDDSSDGGVVWEDDGLTENDVARPRGDDLYVEPLSETEVELAARRDVRPRPPKMPPQTRRRMRAPETGFGGHGQTAAGGGDDVSFGPSRQESPRPVGHVSFDGRGERFARTRATINAPEAPPFAALDQDALPHNRRPPQSRRRTLRAGPPMAIAGVAVPRRRRRSGKITIKLVIAALLIGAGGFAYQQLRDQDIGATIDKLGGLIPLPGSNRTAADTSFGSTVPPEEAVAELAQSARDAGASAPPRTDAPGGVVANAVDPPRPKFKPWGGSAAGFDAKSRSLDSGIAANDLPRRTDQAARPASIVERLWRYLFSG